jgi:hypothetical protein
VRCYCILVHGKLNWVAERPAHDEFGAMKPAGFHCHRFVLAPHEAGAVEATFRRVRENLDSQMGWLRDGLATVELEAEEITPAPIHKLLKPENRGLTFYERE